MSTPHLLWPDGRAKADDVTINAGGAGYSPQGPRIVLQIAQDSRTANIALSIETAKWLRHHLGQWLTALREANHRRN